MTGLRSHEWWKGTRHMGVPLRVHDLKTCRLEPIRRRQQATPKRCISKCGRVWAHDLWWSEGWKWIANWGVEPKSMAESFWPVCLSCQPQLYGWNRACAPISVHYLNRLMTFGTGASVGCAGKGQQAFDSELGVYSSNLPGGFPQSLPSRANAGGASCTCAIRVPSRHGYRSHNIYAYLCIHFQVYVYTINDRWHIYIYTYIFGIIWYSHSVQLIQLVSCIFCKSKRRE